MERLSFDLECRAVSPAPASRLPAPASPPLAGAPAAPVVVGPVVVGVVGSGNLEVLVEGGAPAGRCRVEVATSARGFGEIWRAVVEDFVARQQPAGLRLSVNDAGATPAVVSLRLDQAVEEFRGGRP